MYSTELIDPIKEELTKNGFTHLTTPTKVEETLNDSKDSLLLLINSVCGCAAGSARPALYAAIKHVEVPPKMLVTVFAGVDKEATDKAREYMKPYPASSPSIALFKEGELVHFIERQYIENNTPQYLAEHLVAIFKEHC